MFPVGFLYGLEQRNEPCESAASCCVRGVMLWAISLGLVLRRGATNDEGRSHKEGEGNTDEVYL